MTYRIWKLRTGRRESIPQTVDISIILLSGAVGSFVALFLLLTYFWLSCAYIFYADNPNPIQFTVAKNLLAVGDDSWGSQDQLWESRRTVPKEKLANPYWISSWDEGISAAKHYGKPVLVIFRRDNCYWCDLMDRRTLDSPEIRKRLDDGWVRIQIDINRSDRTGMFEGKAISYRGMARAFHVEGVPASLFIDRSGKPVQTIPGFIPKETFGALLDYMKERVYEQNIPFEKYQTSLASGRR